MSHPSSLHSSWMRRRKEKKAELEKEDQHTWHYIDLSQDPTMLPKTLFWASTHSLHLSQGGAGIKRTPAGRKDSRASEEKEVSSMGENCSLI